MKFLKINAFVYLGLLYAACQSPDKKVVSIPSVKPNEISADSRPKDQVRFLSKVNDNSDYQMPTSAIAKDDAIAWFNKYAADSLKDVKNWEFQVTGIDDDSYHANSVFKRLGNGDNPIYNLNLLAPKIVDNSIDTVALANRVDFTYTTPKTPKGENLKKILSTLKTLKSGDVVVISGAVTHVNDEGKIDFSSFFNDSLEGWNLDILITDIRKKVQ